jgi:type VI secretion system secreted protein Hcp
MAQVDMFLKLDGVQGESQDPDHKNEIQIEGFRLNCMSPRDSFTGQATGIRRWSHLTIRAKVDMSTPLLFQKLATNATIPKAVLACRKAGGGAVTYFTVTLTNVAVAKVQAGDQEDVTPQCEFDLAFSMIEIRAQPQTSLGTGGGNIMFQDDLASKAG